MKIDARYTGKQKDCFFIYLKILFQLHWLCSVKGWNKLYERREGISCGVF